MEGVKWGEFKLMDYGHENPQYVVCFTHSEEFSIKDLEKAIEDQEDFVECAYIIDPEEDDLYKGIFSTIPSCYQDE